MKPMKKKNLAVACVRTLNSRGKLKKGPKITVKIGKPIASRSLKDWDRSDLETVLGPDISVDTILDIEERQEARQSRKKRRSRRKRKKINYQEKARRLQQAWERRRHQIVKVYMCGQYLPEDSECSIENCQTAASHRCLECGTHALFCSTHVQSIHQDIFHMPEVWEDDCFQPAHIQRDPWVRKDGHFETCESQKCREIVTVDAKGRHHKVPVLFCSHEDPGITLLRHRLWPSTMTRTEVAFEYALMDWLEILYLECHVACRSLCQALKLMGQYCSQPVKNIHELLTKETFAEFRLLKQKVRDLQFAEPTLSDDNTCPACPKEAGTKLISLDAIFGLKRWKRATGINAKPRHGTRMFVDQDTVDKYMAEYKPNQKAKSSNEARLCNSFQAADRLRDKNKSCKVDETGVFGAVCRHEVPLRFFNLRRGESYGNAVYMMEILLNEIENTPECNLHILYDIACLLTTHLKKSDDKGHLLEKIKMAVPAFHIYGHKPSCQVAYSPRRLEGFGLTDGEQVERLWAFLRNFAKTTREMTSANRIDALTEALLHYARNSVQQIGEVLVQRYDRAKKTKMLAEAEFKEAMTGNRRTQFIKPDQVERWASNERNALNQTRPADSSKLTTDEKYVETLHRFFNKRQELMTDTGDPDQTQYLSQEVNRLDEMLKKMEKGAPRCSASDPVYKAKLQELKSKQQLCLLHRIHSLACERWFLLKLKGRYAAGQTLAQKISRQITLQSNRLKQAVQQYNDNYANFASKLPQKLSLQDAYNVESNVWSSLDNGESLVGNGIIPVSIKRSLIDLHHRIKRSNEEITMLEGEMANTVVFYKAEKQKLILLLKKLPAQEPYQKGVRCMVKLKLMSVNKKMQHLNELFGKYGRFSHISDITAVEQEVTTEDSADANIENDDDGTEEYVADADTEDGAFGNVENEECVTDVDTEDDVSASAEDEECVSEEDDDYEPLNWLVNAVNTYEDPVTSAESDLE